MVTQHFKRTEGDRGLCHPLWLFSATEAVKMQKSPSSQYIKYTKNSITDLMELLKIIRTDSSEGGSRSFTQKPLTFYVSWCTTENLQRLEIGWVASLTITIQTGRVVFITEWEKSIVTAGHECTERNRKAQSVQFLSAEVDHCLPMRKLLILHFFNFKKKFIARSVCTAEGMKGWDIVSRDGWFNKTWRLLSSSLNPCRTFSVNSNFFLSSSEPVKKNVHMVTVCSALRSTL